MEEFKPIDFYDEKNNLYFHKANPQKGSADEKLFSLLNSWDSENIKKYLLQRSLAPLGSTFRKNARLGDELYFVQDEMLEVVGATLLVPESPISGSLDLLQFIMKHQNNAINPPEYLSINNAVKLVDKNAKGLYIRGIVVDPEKTGNGIGSKILTSIAENVSTLNESDNALCTMGIVKEKNIASIYAFENADYKTIPVSFEGYNKFYAMNEMEF